MNFRRMRGSLVFVFSVVSVITVLLWLGALRERSEARDAEQHFASVRGQFVTLIEDVGHLSSEQLKVEQAYVRELTQLESQLRQYLLQPEEGSQLKKVSARPADLMFEIQSLVDSVGREAKQQNVVLKGRAHAFSFSSILNDGMPSSEKDLTLLGKQCQLIDILAHYLVNAQPEQILKVEREGSESLDFKRTEETFTPQGIFEQRLKEHFSVISFRFSFFGKTQSLRSFLNQVSDSPWPFFITSVSVTPEETISGNAAQKPVVSGSGSNFQVAIAWVEDVS